jgi:SAM-dependent methyltransferase
VDNQRFYGDLAPWWPLISAPEEYEEEAAYAAGLLRGAVGPVTEVLELGSGGGNNAYHLRRHFHLTLVDLSEPMLAVSRALNPECVHERGDMRSVRLGRTFDAVFVHDAISYMTTEDDLRRAIGTAYLHARPGGVAVLMPDEITEIFEPGTDCGGNDGPDGQGARYLAWSYDPDASDTETVTEYAFLLRDADGTVQLARDSHPQGLFPRATWLRLLAEAGFVARAVTEETTDDRRPREVFVARRPG